MQMEKCYLGNALAATQHCSNRCGEFARVTRALLGGAESIDDTLTISLLQRVARGIWVRNSMADPQSEEYPPSQSGMEKLQSFVPEYNLPPTHGGTLPLPRTMTIGAAGGPLTSRTRSKA